MASNNFTIGATSLFVRNNHPPTILQKRKIIKISPLSLQQFANSSGTSVSSSVNSNGRKSVVIKIAKKSPPLNYALNSQSISRDPVVAPRRKRGAIGRNPTPSPSPPPTEHPVVEFQSFARRCTRNPTPSPSPPPPGERENDNFDPNSLFPDQLPVTSYVYNANDEMASDRKLAESLTGDQPVPTLEDLERFVKLFKQKRIKLGFTQGDVGVAMGRMYGLDFSQTTVSRFEAMNLSFKNMCRLKGWLENWMNDTERAVHKGMFEKTLFHETDDVAPKRRKKRTTIEDNLRIMLESVYESVPKPTFDEITSLAEQLNMDRDVIRVWFCNRRQRDKRFFANSTEDQQQPSTTEEQEASCSTSGQTATATAFLIFAHNSRPISAEICGSVNDDDRRTPLLVTTSDVVSSSQFSGGGDERDSSPCLDIDEDQPLDFSESDYLQTNDEDV